MKIDKTFLATTALATMGFGYAARAATCDTVFSFTGAIQTCTTAQAGSYAITVTGASGGTTNGGLGGAASGTFALDAGTTLRILVGAQGYSDGGEGTYSGGGGGGSFVARALGPTLAESTPLAVGGGGGGGFLYIPDPSPGDVGGNGGARIGGNGLGGNYGDYYEGAAGGGGFFGDGIFGYNVGSFGRAFVNGGSGGGYSFSTGGGFGGGGGSNSYGGGGGGGYTGGDAVPIGGGAGGTSFLAAFATDQSFNAGVNLGNGAIEIARLPSPVPLPASLALMLGGAGALGAVHATRRRRKDGAS